MSDTLFVSTQMVEGVGVARVKHEKITDFEANALRGDLSDAAQKFNYRLAIDLTNVLLLASAGIGVLVHMHKTCHEHGGKISVFGVTPDIQKLLELTRLTRLFPIATDQPGAIRALG